jgi:hypothetical protein
MRNRLAAAVSLVLPALCSKADAGLEEMNFMPETLIDGISLSLSGPKRLPLSVVLRSSPTYDGQRTFFEVSLKNESRHIRSLPFDELRRNVVLVYRNPATNAEIVDNRTPPPKLDGAVERLSPGATKTFQVAFEYPAGIATMEKREAALQFCVKWESDWLRHQAYAPGAFDWNASFEVCDELRVVDE